MRVRGELSEGGVALWRVREAGRERETEGEDHMGRGTLGTIISVLVIIVLVILILQLV